VGFLELEPSTLAFFAFVDSTDAVFLVEETLAEVVAVFFCKRVICAQFKKSVGSMGS
jgi:hypothetical protein